MAGTKRLTDAEKKRIAEVVRLGLSQLEAAHAVGVAPRQAHKTGSHPRRRSQVPRLVLLG
jgi:hypothetical protein